MYLMSYDTMYKIKSNFLIRVLDFFFRYKFIFCFISVSNIYFTKITHKSQFFFFKSSKKIYHISVAIQIFTVDL